MMARMMARMLARAWASARGRRRDSPASIDGARARRPG